MDIKTIFDNAENGVLNYQQFMAAAEANKAKFTDLSEGQYVSKQKFDNEISNRDTQINTLNGTISTRDADLLALRTQLNDAGTDADKLANLTKDFTALQGKYDKETKAYQKQLNDQRYEFAVKEFANKQKFTSGAAQRDFTRAMMEKRLQMENDTIIGADDFVNIYKGSNADAFVVEEQPTPPTPTPQPTIPSFVQPTANPTPVENNGTSTFGFNFTGVRKR